MTEIYSFERSFETRFTEYTDLLTNPKDIVPASQIQSKWTHKIEMVIEPAGWEAIWYLPRLRCNEFRLPYPTIVKVEVLSVDYTSLSAVVIITAVFDFIIRLPYKCNAKLIELFPTIEQKNHHLNIKLTALYIDSLRFFYTYLWMPWDNNEDEDNDWVTQHLNSRLRLAYGIKNKTINTHYHISRLIKEAREIEQTIEEIEASISDDEEIREEVANETCQLVQLHYQLDQVKLEMELLENPFMRKIFFRKNLERGPDTIIKRTKYEEEVEIYRNERTIFLVDGCGTFSEVTFPSNIDDIKEITKLRDLSYRVCRVYTDLDKVFKIYQQDDIILLDIDYTMQYAVRLEEGCTIRGIGKPTICPDESLIALSLFDLSGIEISLENLNIELERSRLGIIVRKGTVTMTDCIINGTDHNRVHVPKLYKPIGIVVMPGATLIVKNTFFHELDLALNILKKGRAEIIDCHINICDTGIQVAEDASLKMIGCLVEGSLNCVLRVQTQYYSTAPRKEGGFNLLKYVPGIDVQKCRDLNNDFGVVLVPPSPISDQQVSESDSNIHSS